MSAKVDYFKADALFQGRPSYGDASLSRSGVRVTPPRASSTTVKSVEPLDKDRAKTVDMPSNDLEPKKIKGIKRTTIKATRTERIIQDGDEMEDNTVNLNTTQDIMLDGNIQQQENSRITMRKSMYEMGPRKFQVAIGGDEFKTPEEDTNKFYEPKQSRVKASMLFEEEDSRFNVLDDSDPAPPDYLEQKRVIIPAYYQDGGIDDNDGILSTVDHPNLDHKENYKNEGVVQYDSHQGYA